MFDASSLFAADTSRMEVHAGGKPTGWFWEFAGPGHPKTMAQSNRVMGEGLAAAADAERARVNGRKYKPEIETPEEVRARRVTFIVERLVGWSETTMDGKPFAFTEDAARTFLADPRASGVMTQAFEFLGDEASFTARSSKN